MPIAGGETDYTRYGMNEIIKARAVDVLMPDLQRMAGYTEMRRVAALAATHELPVSTHIFTEHSLCFAGAEPICISVEHMPWFTPLFNETLEISEGYLQASRQPGIGFTFNRETINRFRLD